MTSTTVALRRAATWHRPLTFLVAAMAVLAVVTAVGVFTDDRVLTGAPIWLKPFKFAVSIFLYALTIAWLLSLLPRRSRAAEWFATIITAMLAVEMVVIVAQVLRGQTSHYNQTTLLNNALWQIMSVAIMVLFVAHILISIAVLRARIPGRVAATGVALGLGLSAIGLLAAVPMVSDATGAHTVGAPDGTPGLPVVGWSTVAGDLRVGHFIGLHGLQALPLLAFLLTRYARRLTERTQRGMLFVAGGGYAGLTVLTTWQALRGQPLIHPDGLTLAAFGILVVATAAAATLVLRANRAVELELAA